MWRTSLHYTYRQHFFYLQTSWPLTYRTLVHWHWHCMYGVPWKKHDYLIIYWDCYFQGRQFRIHLPSKWDSHTLTDRVNEQCKYSYWLHNVVAFTVNAGSWCNDETKWQNSRVNFLLICHVKECHLDLFNKSNFKFYRNYLKWITIQDLFFYFQN